MAQKIKEYYICDRCKEVIENYSIKENHVCDSHNAYFYDLCGDCKEVFNDYDEQIKDIVKQFKQITDAYKFGKYMFEEDSDETK